MSARWAFWIDRGGTFTDCIAWSPAGDLHTASEPPAHCDSVSFSPDGRYLAVTDGDRIPIWDMDTGQKAETLALRDFHLVSTVAFSPRSIASGPIRWRQRVISEGSIGNSCWKNSKPQKYCQ